MARDPVCGKEVDEEAVRATTGQTTRGGSPETDPTKGTRRFHNGMWYYFDSLDCRSKFIASPDTYIKKAAG